MKSVLPMCMMIIMLFSCNKEEKGLSYYQFVEGVNNKPVKDTMYYYNTAENKEYKFYAQSNIVGEGFIIWGVGSSNYTTYDVPFTLEYVHAKKKKDRKLTIKGFVVGSQTYTNPIVSPEKITFDGGEIYKIK